MNRRSHRSFRLTRRRDYVRPLALPGNFAFTAEVTRQLWRHRKIFLLLALTYVGMYLVLIGLQSQENYAALSSALGDGESDLYAGDLGAIGQAGLLFVSIFSFGIDPSFTEAQQIFSGLIFLLLWLTTVWLLRNILAGHKVKLRDGLYNSGSPLFSALIVTLLIVVQLIPVLIAVIGYGAAVSTGLLEGGVAAMMFWLAAGLLVVLSLYWITSSLFAMIIVTLPGMYPYKAIKTAGDIMQGRRIKLLLRWVWMALTVLVAGIVVMIPIILLDMGLKHLIPALEWLPLVPVVLVFWTALSIVWIAAYVYLLYRKVVDYVPEQ